MEQAIELTLFGGLAEKYGKQHTYYAHSPAEVFRLMGVNHPGFLLDLAQEPEMFVVVDDTPRLPEMLTGPARAVALVPVLEGRKEGYQTALIIGGALLLGGVGLGLIFGTAGGIGLGLSAGAATMGTSAIIGGVVNTMLMMGASYALNAAVMYATRNDGVDEPDVAKQQLGSTFGGAINTTRPGLPVPVGYGRLRVGSYQLTTSITPIDRPDLLAQGL